MGGENFEAPKAANVRRIGISLTVPGGDEAVRESGRRISEAMSPWWGAVSAWIDVLHGQDLSQLGPVEPGIKFSGATLWSRLNSLQGHPVREGAILPIGSNTFGLVWPNYKSVTAQQLQRCIGLGEQHGHPPAEWLILRDAKSLCAGQDYRRAVFDVGLAAELAITSLIRTHLTVAGHANIEKSCAHIRCLRLSKYWIRECGGTLPRGYQTRLIKRRNAATHAARQHSERARSRRHPTC